jgi:uncharacterized protein (DUF1501 family)
MGLNRRQFIRAGSMSLLVACAPSRSDSTRNLERLAAPLANREGDPLLVSVFLRGAADGLHLVPPTGDPGYRSLRGSLALRETLDFQRDFSLHPELAPLAPLIERKRFAAVHAVGSPDPTRSHFEAQDIMELGEAGSSRMTDGWLARGLRAQTSEGPFASLSLTSEQPLALRGSGAFAIADPERFGLPGVSGRARSAVAALYRSGDDPLQRAGAGALAALDDYERALRSGRFGRSRRRTPNSLSRHVERLLAIDRSGLGVRAAFLESGDWDTHSNQGTTQGRMAGRIRDLGNGIAKLAEGLGERRDWLLVVMTEFGRTVRPNGSRGTDHGHGSVMFVAGPRVRGGLYGDWAGLSPDQLYEGRDLPVLTDWRSVLHEVLHAHLGATPPSDTFPGFAPQHLGLIT